MKKMILCLMMGILIGSLVGCNQNKPKSNIATVEASMPDYLQFVGEHKGPEKGEIYMFKDSRYTGRDAYVTYSEVGSNGVTMSITVIDTPDNKLKQ